MLDTHLFVTLQTSMNTLLFRSEQSANFSLFVFAFVFAVQFLVRFFKIFNLHLRRSFTIYVEAKFIAKESPDS